MQSRALSGPIPVVVGHALHVSSPAQDCLTNVFRSCYKARLTSKISFAPFFPAIPLLKYDQNTPPNTFNLFKIKLPLPGMVSILHRISGAMLFLAIPLALFLLETSLASEGGFEEVKLAMSDGFAKLVLLGLFWALLHHFFAGLRFLAMDLHYCLQLAAKRAAPVSW